MVHAFFVGRALAEAIAEQVEYSFTDLASELGKFDAEQRDRLRNFIDQVLERAQQAEAAATQGRTSTSGVAFIVDEGDLQATIDDLRAEVARLRTELQRYRQTQRTDG